MPVAACAGECSMEPNKNHNRSRIVAAGGVFSALSVVLMLCGSIFPFATFAAPVFAGLCLLPLSIEFGGRTACCAHIVVSTLSLFFSPDREMALFFAVFLGYYPFLQPFLGKIKNRILRTTAKFILFNSAVSLIYAIFLPLIAGIEFTKELLGFSPFMTIGLLLLANIVFCVYDITVDRMRLVYLRKVRNRLFR